MPSPSDSSFDEFPFACSCGKKLKASIDQSGKKGTCPQCRTDFIIPDAPDLFSKKLRCTCGLEMAYNVLDAGKMSQCPQCSRYFEIPGVTKPSLADLVSAELAEKQQKEPFRSKSKGSQVATLTEERKARTTESSIPVRPTPKAIYESWGFGSFFVGIGLFFAMFVGLGVLLIYFGPDLDFDNLSSLVSNNEKKDADDAIPSDPEGGILSENSSHTDKGIVSANEYLRVGLKPSTVSPSYPKDLDKEFARSPLSQAEVTSMTRQLADSLNSRSNESLIRLFDAEILGKQLFGHDSSCSPKDRFLYASEVIEFCKRQPVSKVTPFATAYSPIQLKGEFLGLVRVGNRHRPGLNVKGRPITIETPDFDSRTMRPKFTQTISVNMNPLLQAIPQLDEKLQTIQREAIRWRENLDAKASRDPSGRFPLSELGMRLESGETKTDSPLAEMVDRPIVFLGVVGERSRNGQPAIRELWCLNEQKSFSEMVWRQIDMIKEPKSFTTKAPSESVSFNLQRAFLEEHGNEALKDIVVAALSIESTCGHYLFTSRIPLVYPKDHSVRKHTSHLWRSSLFPYPVETALGPLTVDDCLDSMEDIESFFPLDEFNISAQAIMSARAGFEPEANELRAKAMFVKTTNTDFYEHFLELALRKGDLEVSLGLLNAYKENCTR